MAKGDLGFAPLSTTKNFHHVGYTYAFLCWGLFAVYCIMVQIDRFLLYRARQQRIASNGTIQYKPVSVFAIFSPLRGFGDYAVKIPFVTNLIEVKHIIGMFLFCGINVVWIIAAPFKIAEGQKFVVQAIGLMDRRAAYVGMVNWSFVFVLGSRNNLVSRMSGLSFEGLLPYHRWLARIGLVEYIPHFVYRIMVAYRRSFSVKDSLFRNAEQSTGTVAMIGFLLLFVTSFEFLRRNFFEVFYYSHIIGIFISIIPACMHEAGCIYYFLPTVILWIFDRSWRSYQSWSLKSKLIQIDTVSTNATTDSKSPDGVVRVLFEYEGLRTYKPGQYVFLAIVNKTKRAYRSYLDWHPMTLSESFRATATPAGQEIFNFNSKMTESKMAHEKSGESSEASSNDGSSGNSVIGNLRRRGNDQNVASVHIKTLGKYTSDLLEGASANDEFHLRVDGPYGPRLEYQDYNIMAAFAGGIGVTPALTLIKDCVDRRSAGVQTVMTDRVHLIWALRNLDELEAFSDQIAYWNDQIQSGVEPLRLDLDIYVTREEGHHHWIQDLPGVTVTYGSRPDIKACMDRIAEQASDKKVWLHTCGGNEFMRTVINEGLKRRWTTHRETFEF